DGAGNHWNCTRARHRGYCTRRRNGGAARPADLRTIRDEGARLLLQRAGPRGPCDGAVAAKADRASPQSDVRSDCGAIADEIIKRSEAMAYWRHSGGVRE